MPDPGPDLCSLQHNRLLLSGSASPHGDRWTAVSRNPTSTFDHGRELRVLRQLTPKKSRVKESSNYYGVRFRPDLQKWVAEIRVAEWKSVDKKVWLGTFDTELGAAQAVDVARKLLDCKKKKPFNYPCVKLDTYCETIPSHLNLNHLEKDVMFKEVTQFVKKKAQEYAISLGTNDPSDCYPAIPVIDSFILPTHNLNMEMDFSLDSQTSFASSYGEGYFLPSCEALPTSSLGNISNYNFEILDEEPHCNDLYLDFIASQSKWHPMDLIQPIVECEARDMKSHLSQDDLKPLFLEDIGDNMVLQENLLVGSEHLDLDNEQEFYAQAHASMVECEARDMKSHLSQDDLKPLFLEDIGDNMVLQENLLVGYEHLDLDNEQEFYAQAHASMDNADKEEILHNNCSTYSDTLFEKPTSCGVDTRMDRTLLEVQLFGDSVFGSALDCAGVY